MLIMAYAHVLISSIIFTKVFIFLECDPSCKTCFGSSSTKCSSCFNGSLLINSQCILCEESQNFDNGNCSCCLTGYYLNNNTSLCASSHY